MAMYVEKRVSAFSSTLTSRLICGTVVSFHQHGFWRHDRQRRSTPSLQGHNREKDVGFVKETKLPLSNWCWWHCHESQVTFRLGKLHSWGQGHYSLRAESLWGAPESPNNIKSRLLSSIQCICFQKTSGSNMGAPNLILAPGAISPRYASAWVEDDILTLQNDYKIKARSTSAQHGEHVVFWISTGGG